MFTFTVDGKVIGCAITPSYIKLLANGYYGLCKAEEAEGVVVDGAPFGLAGKGINNLPIVEVDEINDYEFFMSIKESQKTINEYEAAFSEIEKALGVTS